MSDGGARKSALSIAVLETTIGRYQLVLPVGSIERIGLLAEERDPERHRVLDLSEVLGTGEESRGRHTLEVNLGEESFVSITLGEKLNLGNVDWEIFEPLPSFIRGIGERFPVSGAVIGESGSISYLVEPRELIEMYSPEATQ